MKRMDQHVRCVVTHSIVWLAFITVSTATFGAERVNEHVHEWTQDSSFPIELTATDAGVDIANIQPLTIESFKDAQACDAMRTTSKEESGFTWCRCHKVATTVDLVCGFGSTAYTASH